jgi:hypothetical protein
MSDKWLNAQHAEIRERNRRQREEQMREAQRLADERRRKAGR